MATLWLTAALLLLGPPEAALELPDIPVDDYPAELRGRVVETLERARAEPEAAAPTGRLGMLLHAYEQLDGALACYRRARHLEPGSFEWAYLEGAVAAGLGRHDEAAQALRAAVDLRSASWTARLKLADALLATGELDGAAALYRALAAEDPGAAQPRFGLGRVRASRGRLAAAAERYLEATERYPAYGAAHYALVLAYRDLKRPDDARRHLELYREHLLGTPPLEDPMMERVHALEQGARHRLAEGVRLGDAGDILGSIREHEKALEEDPGFEQAHIHLISLYGGLGRWDDAGRHYRAAIALNPRRDEVHYDWGVALARQNRTSEAIAAFRRALEIDPHHPGAHNNLGTLLLPGGELAEATRHFRAALENDPGFRLARFNLARVLGAEGKLDEAIGELHKIVTPEDAETPRYLFALAAAYVRSGQRDVGAEYAREALEKARALGQRALAEIIERDLRRLPPPVEEQP